eukprot:jgi/Phyca11/16424/fgenesh1_pg.PHYCAscaffold_20_\
MSVRDLRLTGLGGRASTIHNRSRSDSRVSKLSRTSSRYITKGKKRKDSNALSTITENWNLADDQFRSPFSEFDAQEQPIREELQRGLAIINDHTVGEILENDSLVTDVESLICFQTKLKEIEDAITAAMSEVWGYWADPIQLYLHPAERVDVQDMINELFNKVLKVFSVLCDEISELKVTVEDNFYAALIMFGQARHGEEGEVKGGEDEVHIGRMLVFFQDISNFMDRCNAITINMINQLAILYQSFQNLWKTTFKLYVRSDPSRYNVTVEKVEQFERLLVCLDQTIKCFRAVSSMTSRCFVTGMLQKTGKKKTGVTATEVADVQAAAGAVEFMFAWKNPILAESSSHLLQQVHLEASKKFDDTKLDVLAAVTDAGEPVRLIWKL